MDINLFIAIASLIVAAVTFFATIVIGKIQIKQNSKMDDLSRKIDERDEKRRNDMIYAEATKFILKYSFPSQDAEIYLLPLCVMAYKYNPIYPYRREMYREFCSLTEDVQNCILQRQEIDIRSSKSDNFYDTMLNYLKLDIKNNYPGDRDLFYENGKYFERSLLRHGNKEIPYASCPADKYQKETYNKFLPFMKNDMTYEDHVTNLLAYEKGKKPIAQLMDKVCDSDEIFISYLACIVAKYTSCYSNSEYNYMNIGHVGDFQGTKYMEDLFLDALFNIFIYR